MSERDDRLDNIRNLVEASSNGLHAVDSETRKEHAAQLKYLDKVLAYAALVLEATDADLVSTNASQVVQGAVSNIVNDPLTALQQADGYGDAVLDAISPLPVARGRDAEQEAKDAAAKFQRSASQRLNSLKSQIADTRSDLAAFKSTLDEQRETSKGEIDAQASAFEAKLAELEQTITTQRVALDEQMTNQSQAFTGTQEERSAEFQEALDGFRDQLKLSQQHLYEEVEKRVAEIRRMEKESSDLVGAIGLAGTAERYSEEAKQQRKAAFWLRALTIVFALGAVAAALKTARYEDQDTESLIARLAVSLILGGLAAYTARQSGRHRQREEHARALQLELTAFSPFIEPLHPAQQEEERVIMTRKTFGKTTAPGASEDDPGPTALSFLMRRRQKQLDEGNLDDEEET